MKKNKKGFVLAETIFVIGVLTVSLVMIYFAFSTVINNQKKRYYFNNPIYLYRTYYILNFLNDLGIKPYLDTQITNGTRIYGGICYDVTFFADRTEEKKLCETMLGDGALFFDSANVYFTAYNLSDALECIDSPEINPCLSWPPLSTNFKSFIRTEYSDNKNTDYLYRILVEYRKKVGDKTYFYYASLGFN